MGRAEAVANRGEVGAEGGVGGEIGEASTRFDDEAAPECAVTVERGARGEVHRGNAMDGGVAERKGLSPVEFVGRADSVRLEKSGEAERDYELRFAAAGEFSQRGEIEMVVVVVTEQNDVDAG